MFKPLLALFALALPLSAADPSPVEELLRQGLYQEEANRDFDKAAENYRAVIAQHDRQRSLAATATYRLGEIARKKGDQAAAAEAFLTVVTRFPEQEDLVRLSRENLTALGTAVPAPPAAPGIAPVAADVSAAEIARLQQLARSSPDLLDGADNDGWRPLHLAAAKGQVKIIAYLLENHADPNGRTIKEQLTPLQLASAHGHLDAVKALLAAKAEINLTVGFWGARTSLPTLDNRGAAAGNRPTATLAQAADTASALDLAILFDRREVARALLAAGADLNEPRLQFGLVFTVMEGRQGPVPLPPGLRGQSQPPTGTQTRLLIDHNIYRLSPLMAAICLQRDALVADLLKAGAPLTLSGPEAAPPALMLAAAYNPTLVPALLKAGADPKAVMPETGATALHLAAEAGFTEAARQLLDAGADPKAPDTANRTPLHFANGAALVELLVKKGADPNAKDAAGFTPLDYTAERGRESGPATLAALFKGGAAPEDPLGLINRSAPACTEALRQPLLRERAYPKEAREDAVLLAILFRPTDGSEPQTAVGVMEVRPAPGSPAPPLDGGLGRFASGNFFGSSVTILRRGAEGRFEQVFKWERKPGESKAPAWPPLAWGDVVELGLVRSQGNEGMAIYNLVPQLSPRTVTVHFEGMEFQRRLTKSDEIWLGSEEAKQRAVEWSPWRQGAGGIVARQPRPRVMPVAPGSPGFPNPSNPYPVDSFGLVPPFVDSARIAVIRKGVVQPMAVDLTNKDAAPLRLLDGDVIEWVMSDAARKYRDEQKCGLLLSGDFTFGGMSSQSQFEQWHYLFGQSGTANEFAYRTDWSRVRLRRSGSDGKVETLDLAKRMASLPPQDQWSRPLLSEALPLLNPGDLMVLPPLPEDADEATRQQAVTIWEKIWQTGNWLQNNR
jgi:ankyrin repeat protein